jgi:serine/threonine protein phosphatase PrpC
MQGIISKPPHLTHEVHGLIQENGFGYFETIGTRPTQEDALAWYLLSERDLTSKESLKQLSPKEIGYRLWTSYRVLDTPDLISGTTAATTIYDGKGNLITAILADAASFAAVYDKSGNVLGAVRLNSVTHKPTEEKEVMRIQENGGYVAAGRVNGSLAISRAIGDYYLKKYGVCSEANIDITSVDKIAQDLNIDSSQIGFLQIINTCDGFTDGAGYSNQTKKKHEDYLLQILKNIPAAGRQPQDELAKRLCTKAIEYGSTDNVSVAIQTISTETPPIFLGVYDGHGGDDASIKVAENIGRVFKELCMLSQEQYAQQEFSVFRNIEAYLRDNKID